MSEPMDAYEFLQHWAHRLADLYGVEPGIDMNAASLKLGHDHHDALHELPIETVRLVVEGWMVAAKSAEMLANTARSVLEYTEGEE